MSTVATRQFPLYLLSIDGNKCFMTLQEAGVTYDDGWRHVELLPYVLEADFTVREISDEERRKIQEIADNYSASK